MGGTSIEIFVNQDLLEKLSPTNQAALILHEALYRRLRDSWEPNSIRTRRSVGYVFAGLSFPNPATTLEKDNLACYHPKMDATRPYLYLFPEKDGSSLKAIRVFTGKMRYNLGYFPSDAEVSSGIDPTNWKKMFSDEACAADPNYSRDVLIRGSGPADYDDSSALFLRCKSGHLEIKFDNLRGPTVGGENSQILKCSSR